MDDSSDVVVGIFVYYCCFISFTVYGPGVSWKNLLEFTLILNWKSPFNLHIFIDYPVSFGLDYLFRHWFDIIQTGFFFFFFGHCFLQWGRHLFLTKISIVITLKCFSKLVTCRENLIVKGCHCQDFPSQTENFLAGTDIVTSPPPMFNYTPPSPCTFETWKSS